MFESRPFLSSSAHGSTSYRRQKVGVKIASWVLTFGPIKNPIKDLTVISDKLSATKIGPCALTSV